MSPAAPPETPRQGQEAPSPTPNAPQTPAAAPVVRETRGRLRKVLGETVKSAGNVARKAAKIGVIASFPTLAIPTILTVKAYQKFAPEAVQSRVNAVVSGARDAIGNTLKDVANVTLAPARLTLAALGDGLDTAETVLEKVLGKVGKGIGMLPKAAGAAIDVVSKHKVGTGVAIGSAVLLSDALFGTTVLHQILDGIMNLGQKVGLNIGGSALSASLNNIWAWLQTGVGKVVSGASWLKSFVW